MEVEKFLRDGKIYIWKETFDIIKSRKAYPNAFANIRDKNDITVVIKQGKYNKKDAIKIQKNWKILTFDMVLPFDLIGFFARISNFMAKEKISIFTVSAYSTDHILIKKKDLPKAKRKLESLGFKVEEK